MTVVNFRTDERSERALAELTADGATVSDAIRQALVDAVRLRRREQMRRESLAMANDPADLAESRQILKEMDELRAGDIHRLRTPRGTRGNEQRGFRYAVILQSDDLMLSTLIVAPTSTSAQPRIFRPTILISGEATQLLTEQTVAVAPERLGDLVGHVSLTEQQAIDAALRLTLGID